ncbi:IS3 family transposase [Enterococcus sp. DIV1537a]|uniref:IS3 family transposase n=1 Tax=Enterococcus sp. DIV1537a TaxID=2774733 RepID=UPI003F6886EC
MDSFFKWMKHKQLKRHTFSSLEEVKLNFFKYIESFYNTRKPNSTIDMLSPNIKEEIYSALYFLMLLFSPTSFLIHKIDTSKSCRIKVA